MKLDEIKKFIPAEYLTAYLAVDTLVSQTNNRENAWILIAAAIIMSAVFFVQVFRRRETGIIHALLLSLMIIAWSAIISKSIMSAFIFDGGPQKVDIGLIGNIYIIIASLVVWALFHKEDDGEEPEGGV